MSSQPKPHFKKVKCIVYWYPEDIEGHTPIPGWQVTPYRQAEDDHFYGVGVTVQEAWEDYLDCVLGVGGFEQYGPIKGEK